MLWVCWEGTDGERSTAQQFRDLGFVAGGRALHEKKKRTPWARDFRNSCQACSVHTGDYEPIPAIEYAAELRRHTYFIPSPSECNK